MAGGSSRTSTPFAEDDPRAQVTYAPVALRLHEPIEVSVRTWDEAAGMLVDRRLVTTVGRIIFNQVIPEQLRFVDREMRRTHLRDLVDRCYRNLGSTATAHLVDGVKRIGFEYATRGGMTIAVSDIEVPTEKKELLDAGRRPGHQDRRGSTSAASSPRTSATRRSSTCGRRPRRPCPTR